MTIETQIQNNIHFIQKVEALMVRVEIQSNNERDMLLAGFSRNLLSHFLSINTLIEKKLYNSAFVLIRAFFENMIRLKYMYYIMDDKKITTIYTANNWDKHFPSINSMIKEIDTFLDTDFYSKIKQTSYRVMNDYTHTGPNQIARNFNELDSTIESSFEDKLILDTLIGSKTLFKTSIIVFLESIGLKNGYVNSEEIDSFLEY